MTGSISANTLLEQVASHDNLIEQGLPLGSPLSPLLGAIALFPLDEIMPTFDDVHYIRFMDDWCVLCRTRQQLRRVVRSTHKALERCGDLKLHPDKTFIGKIDKGFDFLGYHFDGRAQTPATSTIDRSKAKLLALYERITRYPFKRKVQKTLSIKEKMVQYWKRFCRWLFAAVPALTVNINWHKELMPLQEQLPIGIIKALICTADSMTCNVTRAT